MIEDTGFQRSSTELASLIFMRFSYVNNRRNPPSRRAASSTLPSPISLFLVPLAVRLCGIVTPVHDQILRPVVVFTGEVALEDVLHASGIALLRINGRARHMWDHGIPTAPWVLGISQRMVLGRGLREPHITAVTAEMAGLKGLSDVFLDDDSATGRVDEPGAWNYR